TFLWPTMLAVVSERFPKGGAITIGMVGGVGALSAGLLGGPGIGFKQDYFAAQRLEEKKQSTYDRYAASEENTFLGLVHAKGLDGKKTNLLKLEAQSEQLVKEAAQVDTPPDRKQDITLDIVDTKRELQRALDDKPLAAWWTSEGEAHMSQDQKLVREAN